MKYNIDALLDLAVDIMQTVQNKGRIDLSLHDHGKMHVARAFQRRGLLRASPWVGEENIQTFYDALKSSEECI